MSKLHLKQAFPLLVLSAFMALAFGSTAVAGTAAVAPDLGSAATFVALAGSTLTNTGSGIFVGNVGVFPGTEVTGFPPGTVQYGSIYMGGSVPELAQVDALTAYNELAGQVCNVHLTGQDLGGMVLTPGVYCFDTSAQLTGDLVLDGLDDPDAVWVFQIGSTLTTASASTVETINSGRALHVFWQVGSSATLGTGTQFEGNILADASVTLDTGARLIGRAIALHGAVAIDTNGTELPITNTPYYHILFFPIMARQ
jgi:hypothetical protein